MLNIKQRLISRFARPDAVAGPTIAPSATSSVTLVNGKLQPQNGCELNVVDHCNLTCLDCNHASPGVKKKVADPATVLRDFSLLAKFYSPRFVKVLGGEPLLHPDLPAVLQAIRSSGICGYILLVTNGLLLPRMPEVVWTLINELEISVYPDSRLPENVLAVAKQQAIKYGVRLRVYYFDQFRATFATAGYEDQALARRVYKSCKLAHVWGCHTVHEGYLYKCPQSVYIPQLRHLPMERQTQDGIKLTDSPAFVEELYRYLTSSEPLQSCRHCLGTDGKVRPHQLVRPKQWSAEHHFPADGLLDRHRLEQSEAGHPIADDYKQLLEQFSVL